MTNSDYQNTNYYPMHVLESVRHAATTLAHAIAELEQALQQMAKARDELSRNIRDSIGEG